MIYYGYLSDFNVFVRPSLISHDLLSSLCDLEILQLLWGSFSAYTYCLFDLNDAHQ